MTNNSFVPLYCGKCSGVIIKKRTLNGNYLPTIVVLRQQLIQYCINSHVCIARLGRGLAETRCYLPLGPPPHRCETVAENSSPKDPFEQVLGRPAKNQNVCVCQQGTHHTNGNILHDLLSTFTKIKCFYTRIHNST